MSTKSDYSNKKIILEGCNGEWSQGHYLPLLAQRAAREDIELWAIDLEDEIQLRNSQIKRSWEEAHGHHKAHYLNKIEMGQSYKRFSDVTYVFIVTPDQYHCQIAEFWLGRLAPEGKIFIEKPLDAFIQSAFKLRQSLTETNKEDAVFVFSHYLAKVRPLMEDWNRHLKQIGKVEKIEFRILESSPIPLNRAKTLDKGIIFDLFGHILALSGALIEPNLTPSKSISQRVELRKVKAARYYDCPITGETFSWLKFSLDDTQVISLMGKGVAQDDKVMMVYGTNGMIKLDFLIDTYLALDRQGQEISQGKLNPRHVESFLEQIIEEEKQPISIPGIVDFDAGIEILAILDEAKMQIKKIINYQAGEPIDNILKRL